MDGYDDDNDSNNTPPSTAFSSNIRAVLPTSSPIESSGYDDEDNNNTPTYLDPLRTNSTLPADFEEEDNIPIRRNAAPITVSNNPLIESNTSSSGELLSGGYEEDEEGNNPLPSRHIIFAPSNSSESRYSGYDDEENNQQTTSTPLTLSDSSNLPSGYVDEEIPLLENNNNNIISSGSGGEEHEDDKTDVGGYDIDSVDTNNFKSAILQGKKSLDNQTSEIKQLLANTPNPAVPLVFDSDSESSDEEDDSNKHSTIERMNVKKVKNISSLLGADNNFEDWNQRFVIYLYFKVIILSSNFSSNHHIVFNIHFSLVIIYCY